MGSSLQVKREGGVVTATLNRPEKLNALNRDIFDDLSSLLDVLEADKSARLLILTGSGEKAFCVSADLKERQGMGEKAILSRFTQVHRLYRRLENFHLPVIAAMNGIALGGGFELALACDLRVLSKTATVGFPEVDLAIIPGNGGTQRTSRLVGVAKALELILLAKRLTAEEAHEMGLVHELAASSYEVMDVAREWAEKMMKAGPIALRQAKRAIRLGSEQKLVDALETETEAYKACLFSEDRLEGLNAFREKRTPMYQGK